MNFFDILLAKKLENDQDPTVEGLTVTQNGSYSEQGVVYDVVNVALPLDSKTITQNGTYDASDDDLEGYSSVNVNLPLATKSITANGNYKASDDNLEGYTEVDVNVPLPSNAYLKKSVSSLPQPIASFSDGADEVLSDLVVDIEPVQDLHGYDAPWAGGAGKNKLPLSVSEIKSANGGANSWTNNSKEISGIVYTILTDSDENVIGIKANGTATANSILYLMSTTAPPIQLDGQSVIISMAGFSKGAYKDNSWHDILAPSTESTVTLNGDVVQMWGQINNGVQVNNIVIQPMIRLASVSDSTFAPYENICPISGWDEANVSVNGVNQWDEEWEVGKINSDGSVDGDSTRRTTGYINVLPNTTYYMQCPSSAYSGRLAYYNANKELVSFDGSGVSPSTKSFTTPNNAYYVRITIGVDYGTTYNNDISINYPSTDTSYHAYVGTTYTIPFTDSQGNPVEVYGGSVDVVNGGEQPSNKAKVAIPTTGWSTNTVSNTQLIIERTYSDLISVENNDTTIRVISNVLNGKSASDAINNREDGTIAVISRHRLYVVVSKTDYPTLDDFKTMLSEKNAEMCFELETATTFESQPTAVRSLLGSNNIFADTGDVESCGYWSKTE